MKNFLSKFIHETNPSLPWSTKHLGDREPYFLMVQVIWEAPWYLLREWLIKYEDKGEKKKKRGPPNVGEI